MKIHNREILLYYNPTSSSDKKTMAYAKSISSHIKAFSYEDAFISDTNWVRIISLLDKHPKELLNKAHPDYQNNIKGTEAGTGSWVKLLKNNPHLMRAPIAVKGDKAVFCESPTDIYKL